MAVRYRYDSSQPWVVVQGDRWELKNVPASCFGANIQPAVLYDAVIGGYGTNGSLILTPANQQLGNGGTLGTTFDRLEVDRVFITAVFKRSNGQEITSNTAWDSRYGGTGTNRHWHSANVADISFYYYSNPRNFPSGGTLINPETFQNTSSNSCSPASCNFKIYSGQQVTFDITRLTCPEAEVVTNQCPPDTCEVDCGTHVCCYNSQGIPVFSYLK